MYQPRDFIETHEGLVFAVIATEPEAGRVLATLRYVSDRSGWQKVSTRQATQLLRTVYPQYLFYSTKRDVSLHGVPEQAILRHHRPVERLQALLAADTDSAHTNDPLIRKTLALAHFMTAQGVDMRQAGVTGSLLIGAHHTGSDIDLVFYDRAVFHRARQRVQDGIETGVLEALDEALWQETYERRGCALSLAEFIWHERRKFNKGAIQGSKFDLSLVSPPVGDTQPCRKQGRVTLTARIQDDRYAFDYPARYSLEHEQIPEVICYTQTYVGQVRTGELALIAGHLEQSEDGSQCVLIGTSREAGGEYIKIIQEEP